MPNGEDVMPCVHWWICGDPDGVMVHGECRKCGAVRDFEAHVTDAPKAWNLSLRDGFNLSTLGFRMSDPGRVRDMW